MKKSKRKLGVIIIFAIVIVSIVLITTTKKPKNDIYKKMLGCKSAYSSNYKLENANRSYLSTQFEFELKKYEGWFDCVVQTYNAFLENFSDELKNEFKDDCIRLHFSGIENEDYSDEYFVIKLIPENNDLEIFCSMRHAMKLSELAKAFPNADKIELYTVEYDSIEEIGGFKDLKEVNFHGRLSDEEKEYILSLYPDCIIY